MLGLGSKVYNFGIGVQVFSSLRALFGIVDSTWDVYPAHSIPTASHGILFGLLGRVHLNRVNPKPLSHSA